MPEEKVALKPTWGRGLTRRLRLPLLFTVIFAMNSMAIATVDTATASNDAKKPAEIGKRFPELLTYRQMMTLSPEKRQAYLDGVAAMLVEIAQISREKRDDMVVQEARELQGRFIALQMLLVPAEASGGRGLYHPPPAKKYQPSEAVPRRKGSGLLSENWTCDSVSGANGRELVTFDYRLGTCRLADELKSGKACEAGAFVEVALKTGASVKNRARSIKRYCVPQASWDMLSMDRREQLSRPEGATSVADQFNYFWNDEKLPNSVEIALGGRANVGDVAASIKPKAEKSAGSTAEAPKAEAVGAGSCDAGQFACEGTWAERRKAYYDDPNVTTCVFSGNVSEFIGGKKTPGRCTPVFSLKVSQTGPTYQCLTRADTMCNPLVFGVDTEGRPFCVPAKGDATKRCDEASTEQTRKPDFLAQNISGLQESWEKFREGMNALCKTSEASRRFHCEECRVMADRLAALNASTTGTPCGDIKDYETLKAGAAPARPPEEGRSGKVD